MLLCLVIHFQIETLVRPSLPLEVTRLEHALVEHDDMGTFFVQLMHLVIEAQSCLLELTMPLFGSGWHGDDLYLLLPHAEHSVDLVDELRTYSPVWVPPVEQDTTLLYAEVGPYTLTLLVDQELYLLVSDVLPCHLSLNLPLTLVKVLEVASFQPVEGVQIGLLQLVGHFIHRHSHSWPGLVAWP